jgi:hypothetical protein
MKKFRNRYYWKHGNVIFPYFFGGFLHIYPDRSSSLKCPTFKIFHPQSPNIVLRRPYVSSFKASRFAQIKRLTVKVLIIANRAQFISKLRNIYVRSPQYKAESVSRGRRFHPRPLLTPSFDDAFSLSHRALTTA